MALTPKCIAKEEKSRGGVEGDNHRRYFPRLHGTRERTMKGVDVVGGVKE